MRCGPPNQKMSLTRVRLDRGGYDETGRYFGVGEPLYRYDNGYTYEYLRASSRADAKRKIQAKCPQTRFYR